MENEPTLDEIFSETFEEADEAVLNKGVEQAEEPEQVAEPESAKTDDEPPSSEPEKVDPKPIEPEQFKGYLDEREKRQRLERERDELRRQLEAQQQEAPKADPLDDPQGFREQVMQEARAEVFNAKREMMGLVYDDWNEAEAWINDQLGTNAALQAHLSGSQNVLVDAYRMYQQHKELESLKDVDSMKARLREEVMAELKAEMAGEAKAEQVRAAAVSKPSLVSTGTSEGIAAEGALSLEDVLGRDINTRK